MELPLFHWCILITLIIILTGALARLVAINCGLYKMLYIPYPACLIMLGVFLGYCSFTSPTLNHLGHLLTDVDRSQILQMFLPAYVLKVVFLTDWQSFRRCWRQVFMIGAVGFALFAFVVGSFFAYIIDAPLDSARRILLYGAVVSISDPGDHFYEITHLRRIRTTLEGEALLTTALACIILKEDETFVLFTGGGDSSFYISAIGIAGNRSHVLTRRWRLNSTASLYFLLPINAVIGFLVGKFCRILLNHMKCDFNTYVCVSLATGYLIFFAADVLLSYGILSLITYAIVICPIKRSHDLGKDVALTHLWTLLHLIVNIMVCVLAGVIFARNFVVLDEPSTVVLGCLSLYLIVFLVRTIVLIIPSPIWERPAADVPFWHMAAILIWSGMRGSVSLIFVFCLNEPEYRSKLETYAVGMILLNQLINGTTVRSLLIGLDQMLRFKVSSMDTALQYLEDERVLTSKALHNHAILADAQWNVVEKATTIPSSFFKDNTATNVDEGLALTIKQDQKGTEDDNIIRKQVLQAVKVSLTKQYVTDMLSTEAYQILCAAAEAAYHDQPSAVRAANLKHHWDTDSFLSRFYVFIIKTFPKKEDSVHKVYEDHWLLVLLRGIAWEWLIILTVISHAAFLVYSITKTEMETMPSTKFPVFLLYSWLILFQLVSEVFLYAWDRRRYHIPNIVLDASVWFISTLEIITFIYLNIHLLTALLKGMQLIRLIRLCRVISLTKKSLPYTAKFLNQQVTKNLITGYDVGKGYVLAIEDALQVLSRVAGHDSTAGNVIRDELEKDRLEVIKELEDVALRWAVPVTTMKTRQCALGLVRRMQARAVELNLSGVLDDEEQALINRHLVAMLVGIDKTLVVAKPWTAYDVLMQQPEFHSFPDIVKTLMEESVSWCLRPGQTLTSVGEEPTGLYIVCSGLLQCDYQPSRELVKQIKLLGKLPNFDNPRSINFLTRQTEYIREGSIIGFVGLLTKRKSDVSIESVHNARVTYLPMALLDKHLTEEIRKSMWVSYAIRLSVHLLQNLPEYEGWNHLRLLAWLRDSLDVDVSPASWLINPGLAECIVLYEGVVGDPIADVVFTAPCVISSDVKRFALTHQVMSQIPEDAPTARLLVMSSKDWSNGISYSIADDEVKLVVDTEGSEHPDSPHMRSVSVTYV